MSRTILHIDSSIKGHASDSRQLSAKLVNLWQKQFPEDVLISRDISSNPLSHIDADLLNSFVTPAESHTEAMSKALARADELLDEFMSADVVVLGAPMYNFSIPSTLLIQSLQI